MPDEVDQPIEDTYPPATKPATGEILPGCSEPGTVPPSVIGTSQDPTPKPEES